MIHIVERRIREAMEAGDFEDLPGSGRPIKDVDGKYEPLWWVRKWVRREGISADELRRPASE